MSKAQQIQKAAAQLDAAKNVQRVIGGRAADQAVKDATTALQQVAGRRR
ncbi:hypothetical protein GA0070616_0032 [Micromonospora nigra]|uniref:Uncharacterized protein n=1 Tax=Micromonospora nigra TaxID=145857 RepID=A0A1C6R750_9ACTN|nr:hypothetical protein [Micromonospora nigra]SCL12782.1 hypothetical protein GA0070616_0011 [Micromonospora nigra]SCL12821.1 hypothetical protein GA0070616_0032 [Micromonospora nigra]